MSYATLFASSVADIVAQHNEGGLTAAEWNFARWAGDNMRTPQHCAFEILKARRGSRSIHPALDVLLQLEDAAEEPLPFIA